MLVQNNVRGLLTISEAVYPGWFAYVDGVPTPILRVNALSRAVIVPPTVDGKPHEVTFVFRPLSGRVGAAISLLTLAAVCSMLLVLASSTLRPFLVRRPLNRAAPSLV